MTYKSTKTYGHEVGLSCCFRQWRATHSHCQYLHGYAISVRLEFEAAELDDKNWVVDFGGLKEVKEWLQRTFDHKTLVAQDDPKLIRFRALQNEGVIDLVVVPAVGCEMFAKLIFEHVQKWLTLKYNLTEFRVLLKSVEVREHGANSAIYTGG